MAEQYIHLSNTIHTYEKFTYLHIIQLKSIKTLKPINLVLVKYNLYSAFLKLGRVVQFYYPDDVR